MTLSSVSNSSSWSVPENSSRAGTSSGGSLTNRSSPSTTRVSFAFALSRSLDSALSTVRWNRFITAPPDVLPHQGSRSFG